MALMLKTGIGAYICGFLFNDRPVKLYKVSGALEKAGLWVGKHYRYGENRLLAAVSLPGEPLIQGGFCDSDGSCSSPTSLAMSAQVFFKEENVLLLLLSPFCS